VLVGVAVSTGCLADRLSVPTLSVPLLSCGSCMCPMGPTMRTQSLPAPCDVCGAGVSRQVPCLRVFSGPPSGTLLPVAVEVSGTFGESGVEPVREVGSAAPRYLCFFPARFPGIPSLALCCFPAVVTACPGSGVDATPNPKILFRMIFAPLVTCGFVRKESWKSRDHGLYGSLGILRDRPAVPVDLGRGSSHGKGPQWRSEGLARVFTQVARTPSDVL